MKRKLMLFFIVIAYLLICCQKKPKENEVVDVEEAIKTMFPDFYYYSGERIDMNIKNIEPNEAYFINGTAESLKLDGKRIGSMLMPKEDGNVMDEERRWILSDEMIGEAYNEIFMWDSDSFSYTTYQTNKLAYSIREAKDEAGYNLSLYSEKKEFSFGTEEEAMEQVLSFLEESGILLGEDYKADIFYLDYETLMEQERHYDSNGNIVQPEKTYEWSDADNAYLFYIHQTYCGLEDYHHNAPAGGKAEDFNSQIKVIYNKDGIVEVCVSNLSIYNMESEQEELLDFKTIASNVVSHFDYMLGKSTYEIDSAQLVCKFEALDIQEKYMIIPVWSFHVIETVEDGTKRRYEKWFHAVTGECMN